MSKEIKVGDRVKCIEEYDNIFPDRRRKLNIELGKEYIVQKISPHAGGDLLGIHIENRLGALDRQYFYSFRFEKVEEPVYKEGDEVWIKAKVRRSKKDNTNISIYYVPDPPTGFLGNTDILVQNTDIVKHIPKKEEPLKVGYKVTSRCGLQGWILSIWNEEAWVQVSNPSILSTVVLKLKDLEKAS